MQQQRLACVAWMALMCAACELSRGGSGPRAVGDSPSSDSGPLPSDDAGLGGDADIQLLHDAAVDAAQRVLEAGPEDAGPPAPCSDDPALVACYPFDGDTLDHGPRGNHLVATGVSFESGGGVLLNASSGLVRADRAELAHGQTTLVTWLRVDVMPAAGRAGIIDHDGQYGMFVHPGGELRCALGIAGAAPIAKPGVLQQGQWHHITCVAEDDKVRLYVDGDEVANGNGSTTRTPGASPLQVGENAPSGDDQLIGALDDLRIIEAEWTREEVEADAARPR